MRYFSSFVENEICGVKCSWRKWPWRPGEDMLDVSLAPIYLNIYLQV
jgi:hypothetical protein